jgi:uncharacterized protein (DUF433 family)
MPINYLNYIVRDPAICGGDPMIKGTRVPVRTVLANLEDGKSMADILRELPILDENAVRAVIAFAAALAEDDLPHPLSAAGIGRGNRGS